MKVSTRKWKRLGAFILALLMTVTTIDAGNYELFAASKPKPKTISVTTKNSVLGSQKVLYVGGPSGLKTMKVSAKVTPAKASQKVTYHSSNKKIATVTSSGKVTAKKAGTVKITVTSKEKKSVKKVITIKVKKYVYPTKLVVKSSATSLKNGAKAVVKATFAPSNVTFKNVTFSSSNKALATVSSKGVVTANKKGKAGTVKITATAKYKSKSNKTVSASVYIKVGTVVVKPATYKISYVLNGGTNGSGNPTSYTAGKGVAKLANATKSGSVFVGWYSDATFKNKVTSISASAKGNITLYARFEIAAKEISLNEHELSYRLTGDMEEPIYPDVWVEVSPSQAGYEFTSSDPEVVDIDEDGLVTVRGIGTAELIAKSYNGLTDSCKITVDKSTVAIHDPSIFNDPNSDNYYTVGTALGMAVSKDLKAWSPVELSFNKGLKEELKPLYTYTTCDPTGGNFWAADMIWNTSTEKYNMYICATCSSNYVCKTAICMLSADEPTGPYSYEGMIVCADFNKTSIETTNIREALGLSATDSIPNRYWSENDTFVSKSQSSQYYKDNFPDCIDPEPFYGPDGQLYLLYGSFTCKGGIHILKLGEDGLRDAELNYDYEKGVSDPYFGKRLTNSAGEGPYILKVKSSKSKTGYYYFLFTSSGILRGTGTYRMSMWRSETPDGDYVDISGKDAKSGGGSVVAYNYKFSFMPMAYTAMGGNSALVDDDGKIYVVYHNKFEDNSANPGTHMLKTHQAFLNEDGWLVMAPFEYNGETAASSYTTAEIAGDYEFIAHNIGTVGVYGSYTYNKSKALKLTSDGKVSGALTGTWKVSGNKITIVAGNTTYKGVLSYGHEDNGSTGSYITAQERTLTFTAVGNNMLNVWGSKVSATEEEATAYDLSKISLNAEEKSNFEVPVSGLYGSVITWTSDDPDVISIKGNVATVKPQIEDVDVTLTAKATKGKNTQTKDFTVKVLHAELDISTIVASDTINLPTKLLDRSVEWTSSNPAVIEDNGTVHRSETEYYTVTLTALIGGEKECTFDVIVLPKKEGTPIYKEDFTGETDASKFLISPSYQNGATIETDPDASIGTYLQYNSAAQNSRGADYDFGITSGVDGIYTVEFDASLKAGNDQTTNFALVTTEEKYNSNNVNYGIESGYVFALSATKGATEWSILGTDQTVVLPLNWVHFKVIVDTQHGNAVLTISSGENVLYQGNLKMSGNAALKGIYIQGGRYQSLTKMDNVKVY